MWCVSQFRLTQPTHCQRAVRFKFLMKTMSRTWTNSTSAFQEKYTANGYCSSHRDKCDNSSATLLLTLQCCDKRNKIDRRISRFMLPIGTNVNMDGTALYEVVAAVFIAQFNHINLDFSQLITIAVTSAVSSIIAAGNQQLDQ
ncbi:excitatory amino acid transporter 3-like protein [Lates japonicus]|uniref:Amino acid transporter n=1 Tax=Lates japonicus TaxID=270547 RepID=A0AAD3QWX1_LATJO|nr:excitatory amino acid transporter 3-like protein [Lates japonicus]